MNTSKNTIYNAQGKRIKKSYSQNVHEYFIAPSRAFSSLKVVEVVQAYFDAVWVLDFDLVAWVCGHWRICKKARKSGL